MTINKIRKFAFGLMIFNAVMIIATIVLVIYLGYSALTNPEAIGEFVGKIFNGFNNTK